MSFRLFARGTGNYHHSKDYGDEGDVYDLADALGRFGAMSDGVASTVTNELSGAVPNSDFGLQTGLNSTGGLTNVDLLRTNFTLALVNARQMMVFVHARSPNLIFPADSANTVANYTATGRSPARDFMRHIHPTLETAGLNRFVVIGALAEVFGVWGGDGGPWGERMLNITITNT